MEKTIELAEALFEILEENIKLQVKINNAIDYIKNEDIDICTIRNNDIIDTKNELLEILGDSENVNK